MVVAALLVFDAIPLNWAAQAFGLGAAPGRREDAAALGRAARPRARAHRRGGSAEPGPRLPGRRRGRRRSAWPPTAATKRGRKSAKLSKASCLACLNRTSLSNPNFLRDVEKLSGALGDPVV